MSESDKSELNLTEEALAQEALAEVDDTEELAQLSKEKKDKPVAKKKKKETIFARLSRTFREMKSELKKVVWPTRKQTVNNTLVVIACCIVVGICIWLFDWVANLVIDALISLF